MQRATHTRIIATAALAAATPMLVATTALAQYYEYWHHYERRPGLALLFVILFAVVYLLPGIIASSRRHRNATAIWVLDIFLGWTFFGWVVALVWAVMNER